MARHHKDRDEAMMDNYGGICLEIPIFRFVLNEGLDDQFLPAKGSERATGWDVRSESDHTIYCGQYIKISLGFRVLPPEGWWLECRPRSSTFTKKNLHALYGVIDEDFEGQCIFACQYLPDFVGVLDANYTKLVIKAGEAIGQIIPVRRQEMLVKKVTDEEYKSFCQERNTSRGTGGFGSTG
jgi:dUTP pyrophosphatase